jgi:hypothetical protein
MSVRSSATLLSFRHATVAGLREAAAGVSGRWGNELSFVSTCCRIHDDVECAAGEVSLQMTAKARVTVVHAEQVHFFRPSVGRRRGSPGARGSARASIRSCLSLGAQVRARGAALLERRARSRRAIA